MSFFRYVFFFVFVFCFIPKTVFAVVDPTAVPNNKFGIHIAVADEQDLKDAAALVNSSGGDWGYVTVVIQENDRDTGKWQDIFNTMRKLHLIPIVRIASQQQGAVWKRPSADDAQGWADFLDSLNWVVENRYVVLYNEPNHAQEWGGEVLPEDYAHVAYTFAKTLKEKNPDFYVMLAGLDEAAPSSMPRHEDAGVFLSRVLATKDSASWGAVLDGICAHAYPNPGFVGSPDGWGKASVRGYQWLQDIFSQGGIIKKMPVFITETGWDQSKVGEETASQYLLQTFQNIWLSDANIVAVTPFILNYQSDPFLGFSWKKKEADSFYTIYTKTQEFLKQKGAPKQREKIEILSSLPTTFTAESKIGFALRIKNKGQSIIDAFDGYKIAVLQANKGFEEVISPIVLLGPGEETNISVFIKTPKKTGYTKSRIVLKKNDEQVSVIAPWNRRIVPKINMVVFVKLLLGFTREVGGYEVQVYDQRERIIFKRADMNTVNGKISLKDIPNVIVGESYRVVILRPYYLPRQTHVQLKETNNEVRVKPMLPLDWNRDGKWNWKDMIWFL
ncbi:hypothetical protein COU88_04285 [Candidatus Roizmanbacteria bacterium CG10_big_fil_rev_8_21_14_0_10_39_6]|uniref:Asl1-like glycosyl hydrolase catalytic domain-containing protein n=1 Tax=Candidatus Roizmanbacteria bacterium CG10_big_fil_rev_8_21_14_0_10_39_6 TaxID=1974853 RepID=A0A2M8KRN7_9BACT|nr:MAG: hypothetical protein COU88_04285 [Candidatus Roizmanbacteria bacterium CG10_big_fil_rev_8_21_14_0_10_39_6]